jgi:CBS-domain-containing membrane protein
MRAARRRRLVNVGPALELVAVILFPTALGFGIIGATRAYRWMAQRRYSRLHATQQLEPIERIGARLRRLREELEATETRIDVPAKNLRLRALRAAYLDVLCAACERLEVTPPPKDAQVPQAEIYRVEAALRQRGLDVRQTAPR